MKFFDDETGDEIEVIFPPPEIQSIYPEEIDQFDGLREFLENFVSLPDDEIVSDTQNDRDYQLVYVYDPVSLRDLLDKNKDVLKENGWPTDPNKFVNYVCLIIARSKSALFDLVADVFGDKTNTGRTDVNG